MAQINTKQSPNQTHSRSLSQPSFFGNHGLPPLSPFPPSEPSFTCSKLNLKNVSMEEVDVCSRVSATALASPGDNPFCGNNGLPPRRGHRRANSDVALGFSAMIQSSPQLVPISSQAISGRQIDLGINLGNGKCIGVKRRGIDTSGCSKGYVDGLSEIKPEGEVVDDLLHSQMNVDAFNSTGVDGKDKDNVSSGSKISYGDGSNSDSETVSRNCTNSCQRVKRSVDGGDIAPQFRHSRSLSMDSGVGNFSSSLADPLSPSNSLNESSAKVDMDFGHGGFNEIELKKLVADEKLAEIAILDPKRVKRILANRQSAARSKERKLRYISELEHKVQMLQTEASTLSAHITTLQNNHAELTSQNNELKLRIQAMEQEARLRDEVKRLRLSNIELREEGRSSNGITQSANIRHQMLPMSEQQPNQIQRSSVTTS